MVIEQQLHVVAEKGIASGWTLASGPTMTFASRCLTATISP